MEKPIIKIRQHQGVTIVEFLDKDINILDEDTVNEINQYLFSLVADHSPVKLLLSFSNVNYFSSGLLGTFIRVSKKVLESGGAFKLCGINSSIWQMFTLTKLDQILDIYENEESAVNSFVS